MSNDRIPRPTICRETDLEHLTVRLVRERDDLERLRPMGEIDVSTAAILRDALVDVERRGVPNVLVDLSGVEFLALAGVHLLRAAGKRAAAANGRLVLIAPTPHVQRVLVLTEVTDELEVYVTHADALSSLVAA